MSAPDACRPLGYNNKHNPTSLDYLEFGGLIDMPWITERSDFISWDRLQKLMDQTVAEARKRICAKPKRVLLLPPDITRMLDKLEQRGLIARERPASDRRIVRVAITPAGLELLDTIAEPLHECHRKQLGHLPPEELQQLAGLLRTARLPHEPPASTWK